MVYKIDNVKVRLLIPVGATLLTDLKWFCYVQSIPCEQVVTNCNRPPTADAVFAFTAAGRLCALVGTRKAAAKGAA